MKIKGFIRLFVIVAVLIVSACKTEERHVFVYTITGDDIVGYNLLGVMGPGITFELEKVDIPFEVEHEVFGNNLDYQIKVEHIDPSKQFEMKVLIDGKLIEQKNEWVTENGKHKMEIKGVFN